MDGRTPHGWNRLAATLLAQFSRGKASSSSAVTRRNCSPGWAVIMALISSSVIAGDSGLSLIERWSPRLVEHPNNPGGWLRSCWIAATTPLLARRRPAPPPTSALQTRSASKHSMLTSALQTKHLALADREAPRSFLLSDLAKLAVREPLRAAGATRGLLFARGFLRWVRDNGLRQGSLYLLWPGLGVLQYRRGRFCLHLYCPRGQP